MYVDRSGNHCFLVCHDCIFYSFFRSPYLEEIQIGVEEVGARNFSSLDLDFISGNDWRGFKLVLGRADGSIWFGCFELNHETGLECFKPVEQVLDGRHLGYRPILDIKIVK